MIKFLSNDRRMTIVAAGSHEALHVMRFDPQIASRFEQIELPVSAETEELRCFVAGYLAMLPVAGTLQQSTSDSSSTHWPLHMESPVV